MGTMPGLGSLSSQTNALQSREDMLMRQMKSPANATDDAKIEKGSKEFEAILVGSWLQQAEQSFATVPGLDQDQDPGADQMMSLGVQQLATAMSSSGGIGIAKMIAKAMHADAERTNAPAATPAQSASLAKEPTDSARNR